MIIIEDDLVLIEFKKGPASNDPSGCIRLAMEILNLSKSFSSFIKKGKKPGKKMEKTGHIRAGIEKFVNKTDVTPKIIDELICSIRKGRIAKISTQIDGAREVELYPDNDVPGVVARFLVGVNRN
jgi:hypothetical protein